MADPIFGLTGEDIRDQVIAYIGNDTDDFKNWLNVALPLAEHRVLKLHDWSYLRINGLTLPLLNGTQDYELNAATVTELTGNQFIPADSIETIVVPETGVVLRKIERGQLIQADPEEDDGSDGSDAQGWARLDQTKIRIYPPLFKNQTAKLYGRRQEASLTTLTNTLQIPYRYQNSFIRYVEALALDRENDVRGDTAKVEAASLIREDIADDMAQTGDKLNPRIKDIREAQAEGFSQQLNSILWATIRFD